MRSDATLFKLLELYATRLQHRGQWRIVAWLRKLLKIDVDADIEVVRADLRWILNPADFVQADIFWYGCKDRWELHHIRRFLMPASVVVDAGANDLRNLLHELGYSLFSIQRDRPIPLGKSPVHRTHERLLDSREYTSQTARNRKDG